MTPQEEHEHGKAWILETLRTIAEAAGVPLDQASWDVDPSVQYLTVRAKGKRIVEAFTDGEIEDVRGDADTRAELESRLGHLVTKIQQP
jgi:hypothetical protein